MNRSHLPFLLLGLTLAAPLNARVVYVNKAAPGPTHDGLSWSTACLTVAAGVAASAAGDEIWVAAATYNEFVTVGKVVALYGGFAGTETERSQRDIVANTTVLDGGAAGTVLTCAANGVVVDGFAIRNCGANFRGVHVSSGAATLVNNTITAHKGPAVYLQAKTTLTGNLITDNASSGVNVVGVAATLVGNTVSACRNGGILSSGTLTMTGNTLTGNDYAVAVSGGTATLRNNLVVSNTGYAVRVTNGTLNLVGNTICGNSGNGVSASGGTTHLTNNVVAFNTPYGLYKGTYATVGTVSHNDVFGNTTANYSGIADQTGTNGNLSADPLFANRAGGDYHLTAGSPCIDAGADGAVLDGETDRYGNPRISGAHVDIGACEYIPSLPPFTLADVTRCLSLAGGLAIASGDDATRLNVDSGTVTLDLMDAARLARKAAGLEPNP